MAKFKINLEAEKEKTAAAKDAGRNSAKETQPAGNKPAKETENIAHVQTQVEEHVQTHEQAQEQTHVETHVHAQAGFKPEAQPETTGIEKRPAFARTLEPVKRDLGTTKGKKGQKLSRINMAFSDQNYNFIREESERLNMTMTEFVNELIKIYREQ